MHNKMIQQHILACLFFISFMALPTRLSAWNIPGHMLSAALAYQVLQQEHPQTIERVKAVLEKHPWYANQWQARGSGCFAWVKSRSFTVSAEGLHHSIHITEEACNVGSIQDRSIGEPGRPDCLDILWSNVAGVPRHLFRKR